MKPVAVIAFLLLLAWGAHAVGEWAGSWIGAPLVKIVHNTPQA